MKIIVKPCYYFILGVVFLPMLGFSQVETLQNVEALAEYNGIAKSIIVSDRLSGGIFNFSTEKLLPDSGVVFPGRNGGVWVRSFNIAQGVNPCWWGARGDGVHDDLKAIDRATKYCLENETILHFPSGVFRLTDQWVIGSKFIEGEDIFLSAPWTGSKTFNNKAYGDSRRSSPVIVRGSINTCIYGDFDSKELKAIIYYGIKANGFSNNPSSRNYNHEFTNISVYGRGCFSGAAPKIPSQVNEKNNQIGLLVVSSDKVQINNCDFVGLKYGLFFNTSYWGSVSNTSFEVCSTGFFAVAYNANLIQNVYATFCNVGFDIIGNELCINSINSGRCEIALRIRGKYNVINQIYFENSNLGANKYQLVLGRGKSDPSFGKASNSTGIIINACTITAHGRPSILLEEDMRDVYINGGQINGEIKSVHSSNKITLKSVQGSYKLTGVGKLYKEQ